MNLKEVSQQGFDQAIVKLVESDKYGQAVAESMRLAELGVSCVVFTRPELITCWRERIAALA